MLAMSRRTVADHRTKPCARCNRMDYPNSPQETTPAYRRGRPRPGWMGARPVRRSVICSGVMASRSRSRARRTTELRLITFRPPRRTLAYSHSLSHKSFCWSSHTWRGSTGTEGSCPAALGGPALLRGAGAPSGAGLAGAEAATDAAAVTAGTRAGPEPGAGAGAGCATAASAAVRSMTWAVWSSGPASSPASGGTGRG